METPFPSVALILSHLTTLVITARGVSCRRFLIHGGAYAPAGRRDIII